MEVVYQTIMFGANIKSKEQRKGFFPTYPLMIEVCTLIDCAIALKQVDEMDFLELLLGGFRAHNPHKKVVDHFEQRSLI